MEKSRVQVGTPRYSEKSIGVLVELIIGPKPNDFSAGRLEWFPKSLCEIEEIREEGVLPKYFLTAPNWLLEEKKVSCEILK